MAKRQIETKQRGQRKRSRKNIFLICCEDEKSSRFYFNGFQKKIPTIDIQVPKHKENDPVKIVDFAINKKASKDLEPNDSVWCVFDVDENTNDKLNEANQLAKKNDITCILSNPSFEIWYLLHHKCTTKHYSNKELERELKNHLPNYDKNDDTIFNQVYGLTGTAIPNAKKLETFHNEEKRIIYSRESNPSTMVYELVEELQKNIS